MMKRVAIRTFVTIALLAIAIVMVFAVENAKARKAWAQFEIESTEWGGIAVLDDFKLPPIPDEENFAAIPFFQALFKGGKEKAEMQAKVELNGKLEKAERPPKESWCYGTPTNLAAWKAYLETENLREFLRAYDSVLNEIAEAGLRPKSQFPLDMEEGPSLTLPHGTVLMRLADLLALRSKVSLEEKKPEKAADDVALIFRLGDALNSQPLLLHLMIEAKIREQAVGVIWEGLAAHQWNKSELARLKAYLRKVDIISTARQAMRAEQAYTNFEWERMRKSPQRIEVQKEFDKPFYNAWKLYTYAPSGWTLQNQLAANQFFQRYVEALCDSIIRPDAFAFKFKKPHVYHYILVEGGPDIYETGVRQAVFVQNAVNQALIACALEEYRLNHGVLPKALNALTPRYLDKLPVDPMAAKPSTYRKRDDGSFLLYSIGWNGNDDDGTVARQKSGRQDQENGDWVWFGSPKTNLTKE